MAERTAHIDRARDAVARRAWSEAHDLFGALDPSSLEAGDLEALADAAWWLSRIEGSLEARRRAYASYAASGDDVGAGRTATRLCIDHFLRQETAVAAGWLKRAERHLHDLPEVAEHGFLAVVQATVARFGGDLGAALDLSQRAARIGRRLADPDLIAMAIHTEGLARIAAGEVEEGVALLDEAMTSVVAGELSDYYTGAVYCNVLEACLGIADLRRAGEWNDAARAWCGSLPPDSPYPGFCRVNRAEVAALRGAWTEAEAEATRAAQELIRVNPMAAAPAFYEAGEIRRRMGDARGAEEAFARARELGLEPQPGLALLRLHQGKVEAADRALRMAPDPDATSPLRRATLLGAMVEVALAAGNVDAAGSAAGDLASMAARREAPAIAAEAARCRGAVALAEGDPIAAVEHLRRAWTTWQQIGLPYEAARARMLYGTALRALGEEEGALLELRAALSAFQRLGAAPDVAEATALIGGGQELPGGISAREAEVLRLVAVGKTNREIADELVISPHTVARHLQNIFAKLDVPSRSAATAFAVEHGLV